MTEPDKLEAKIRLFTRRTLQIGACVAVPGIVIMVLAGRDVHGALVYRSFPAFVVGAVIAGLGFACLATGAVVYAIYDSHKDSQKGSAGSAQTPKPPLKRDPWLSGPGLPTGLGSEAGDQAAHPPQ
jgi:hypothetical protein